MMVAGNLIAAVVLYPIYLAIAAAADPIRPVALTLLVFAQMVPFVILYAPLAAFLVEAFPANVRYVTEHAGRTGSEAIGGWITDEGRPPGLPSSCHPPITHAPSGRDAHWSGVPGGHLTEEADHSVEGRTVLERAKSDAQPVLLDQRGARMRIQRFHDPGALLGPTGEVQLELWRVATGDADRPECRLRPCELKRQHPCRRVGPIEADGLGARDAPFDETVKDRDEARQLGATGLALHGGDKCLAGGG